MADQLVEEIQLLPEQEAEGYSAFFEEGYIQVWHRNTQIGLLLNREGVAQRTRDLVERRRKELQEVYEKTGWKPE